MKVTKAASSPPIMSSKEGYAWKHKAEKKRDELHQLRRALKELLRK